MKIYRYPRDRRALEKLFTSADEERDEQILKTVQGIVDDVRARGDAALADYSGKFDGRRLTGSKLRVDPALCERAWNNLPPELAEALRFARANIEEFHRRQLRTGFVLRRGGVRLEQRIRPLRRVGAYVPGGRAPLPSSMLMNVIPAQVAGVQEIVVATPPLRDDLEKSVILAVAHLLGVSDSVYQMGGAQAIAAMAFGTRTVPRVDKVVGPGNRFVALAKRLLYGVIDIDSIAGNSEVLVIADSSAPPDYVAADLMAQAEHTGDESIVLVGIGDDYDFKAVEEAIERGLATAPRAELIRRSLQTGGVFVRAENAEAAIEITELKAPEHLQVMTRDAESIVDRISNVGAAFVGPFSPVPLGDYAAGPNHVLPTGGTARFFSPLGVDAFLKASNVITYSEAAFRKAAPHVAVLAESEGLHAHAESVRLRLRD